MLAHPEATPEVVALADFTGSTSSIIEQAQKVKEDEVIVVTEEGIRSDLEARCPNKTFYFPKKMHCADMKMVTADKVLDVLENGGNEMDVPTEVIEGARKPLERMLELGREE